MEQINEEWRKNAPPIAPEELHMNPLHLQRLYYNPNYYEVKEEDLKIGDDVVIGEYASDSNGGPNIRWREATIKGFPLWKFHYTPIRIMKHI